MGRQNAAKRADPKPQGLLEDVIISRAPFLLWTSSFTMKLHGTPAPAGKAVGESRGRHGEGERQTDHAQVGRKGFFQGANPWDLRKHVSQSSEVKRFEEARSCALNGC